MKEATGELSGTVITIVAIAAVAAIFTVVLLPILKNNITQKTKCAAAYACNTSSCSSNGGSMSCKYQDENGNEQTIKCDCTNAK